MAVAFGGATNVLGIDPNSGRIVSQSYRGQGPDVRFGTVERRFSNYAMINGVKFPLSAVVLYEGEPIDGSPVTLNSVRIDGDLDEATFRTPG